MKTKLQLAWFHLQHDNTLNKERDVSVNNTLILSPPPITIRGLQHADIRDGLS